MAEPPNGWKVLELHTEQLQRIETEVAAIRKQLGDFSITRFSAALGEIRGRTVVWSGIVALIVASIIGVFVQLTMRPPPAAAVDTVPAMHESLERLIGYLERQEARMDKATQKEKQR